VASPIRITIYRWAGQKWFFRIRSECAECDLAVGQARALLSAHPDWPVELEVKPWLTHLWEALRHGGWHAPAVLVDGQLLRQGTVPTRAELEVAVRGSLERRGIPLAHPGKQEELPQAGSGLTLGGR
jgi:hypothetical protein